MLASVLLVLYSAVAISARAVERDNSAGPSKTITYRSGDPAATASPVPNVKPNVTLERELKDATLAVDRLKILYDAGPSRWKFDFTPKANPCVFCLSGWALADVEQ